MNSLEDSGRSSPGGWMEEHFRKCAHLAQRCDRCQITFAAEWNGISARGYAADSFRKH
jgi:hypothetical protein